MDRVLARAGGIARPVPQVTPAPTGAHVTEAQAAANLAAILGAVPIKRTLVSNGREVG